MDHLTNDICSNATCLYCGELITDEPGVDIGGVRLHQKCSDEAMADDQPPEDYEPTEDDLEYAYQSYYGFGSAPIRPIH